jgi:hypothetical protein
MPKLSTKMKRNLAKEIAEAEAKLKELRSEQSGKKSKVSKQVASKATKRGTSPTRQVDEKYRKAKKKYDKHEKELNDEKRYISRKVEEVKEELKKFKAPGTIRRELLKKLKGYRESLSKFVKRKRDYQEPQVKKINEYGLQVEKVDNKSIFKKTDGISDRVYTVKPVPVTESTVKHLSHEIYQLVKRQIADVKSKNRGGYKIKIKAFMQADSVMASAVIHAENADGSALERLIYNELSKRSNKHYPTEDYLLYLRSVSVFVATLGDSGGCRDGKTKMDKIQLDKDVILKLINHKSKGNNCLFQCFNHSYEVCGNSMKGSLIRKALGLKEDAKIKLNMIPKISEYYNEQCKKNLGYVVMNEHNEVILFKHPAGKERETDEELYDDGSELVRIYLCNEHYYSYDMIMYFRCQNCGLRVTSESKHHCNKDRASYFHTQISHQKDIVRSMKIKTKEKVEYNDIVHWDLETFQPSGGVQHEVYASAYWAEGKYKVYYGKQSMEKMVDDFMDFEKKIVNAYNGSGFDFYFLIDQLTERGAMIEDIIINNGKVMKFHYRTSKMKKGERNSVFDLYLFTMSSLASACDDFKVKNVKSSFEHSKMKSWDDVEKYKSEVYPYLKLDVLALRDLFVCFNDMIYEIKQINITDFVTASHMGYTIWQNELDEVVEIPKCMDKLKFIRKATFGGRCYPHQQQYQSKLYDEIMSKEKTYEDLLKSKDFIFNADASSLYPASMAGFEHMKVEYPIGKSRWSEDPKKEFDDDKIGFYEIDYVPPKDIRIPVLPRDKLSHGAKIGVEWSLHDGSGVFTSVDIMNAIEAGYKVKFINKCLVYDKKGDVFTKYIKTFYELKGKAEKEGNDCLRSIAKLLLNSLYGKMLMAPIVSSSKIINDAVELHKFFREFNMSDYIVLSDKRLLMTGEVKDEDKVSKITKPSQLGAFCLGYSRRIMLFYMKEVDPTLKSLIFTYTDTDSLHISGEAYLMLQKKGLIKTKKEATLGFLCSDIKNEGFIIKELNLAPKTYMYEYIDQAGAFGETKKCKGIPKRALKELNYEDDQGQAIEFSGLKKKIKLTKGDVEKGVGHFSVCNNTQTRTFMKNQWSGMVLHENQYYPQGYKI